MVSFSNASFVLVEGVSSRSMPLSATVEVRILCRKIAFHPIPTLDDDAEDAADLGRDDTIARNVRDTLGN